MRAQIASPLHSEWLRSRTRAALTSGFRAIEAVDSKGKIRGMVGFDSWTPNAVQAHMAVDTPIAWRCLLPMAADYAFRHAGCGLILGLVPAFNDSSLRTAEAIGFKVVCSIKDGWSIGVDLLVHELRRESCRWLKEAPNG